MTAAADLPLDQARRALGRYREETDGTFGIAPISVDLADALADSLDDLLAALERRLRTPASSPDSTPGPVQRPGPSPLTDRPGACAPGPGVLP